MTHITPLRLIAAAAILGIAGGGFVGLTFALQGGAIFAAFLTGNLLLGLAALAGTLGVISLAVEIGIRAAARQTWNERAAERAAEAEKIAALERGLSRS